MAAVDQRKKDVENAFKMYQSYLKELPDYKRELQDRMSSQWNNNQDLVDASQKVMAERYSTPAKLRADYYNSAIRDPLKQEALIAGRVGNLVSQQNRLNQMYQERGADQKSVLDAYLDNYKMQMAVPQSAYEYALQMYDRAVQEDQFNRQLAASYARSNQPEDLRDIDAEFQDLAAQYRLARNLEGDKRIPVDISFQALKGMNNSYDLGYSNEQIWRLLGNTPGGGTGSTSESDIESSVKPTIRSTLSNWWKKMRQPAINAPNQVNNIISALKDKY